MDLSFPKGKKYWSEWLVYTIVFLCSLRLFYNQTTFQGDFVVHISIIDPYIYHSFYIPHPLFHFLAFVLGKLTGMPYTFVVPLLLSVTLVVTVILTKKIVQFSLACKKYTYMCLFAAISANFVIAVYFPWFSKSMYLGQWGPNIWHSPTMVMLKPFAILSFFGMIYYINHTDSANKRATNLLVSLSLLASTFAKPSFILCFLPALGLYLLIFHTKNFKLWLGVFYLIAPSVVLLLYQFIRTYNLNDTSSHFHDSIIFTYFGVLKLYTKNLTVSVLLATMFPVSVAIVLGKKIVKNPYLIAAWFLAIISFLQASFFAEKIKFDQGAFIFGYIICLFILFLVSLIEFLSWFDAEKKEKINPFIKYTVLVIFMLHLNSGIINFIDLMMHQHMFT